MPVSCGFPRQPACVQSSDDGDGEPRALFTEGFFKKLKSGARPLVFDFAQPPDVEKNEETLRYITLFHLEDLQEEARQNSAARTQSIHEAETVIEEALREYCRDQKEAPLLRDFNSIEPRFLEELAARWLRWKRNFPPKSTPKLENGRKNS